MGPVTMKLLSWHRWKQGSSSRWSRCSDFSWEDLKYWLTDIGIFKFIHSFPLISSLWTKWSCLFLQTARWLVKWTWDSSSPRSTTMMKQANDSLPRFGNVNDETQFDWSRFRLQPSIAPFALFPCQVMLDLYSLPEVAKLTAKQSACTVLTHVPVSTRKGVYLHPWQLDMSEEAKFGSPGKFPSNVGIRNHFASVVHRGYESDKEALEIKFPPNLHGSGLEIPMFSTGFIDGHTKATMVLAVFALLEHIAARHRYTCSSFTWMFCIPNIRYC